MAKCSISGEKFINFVFSPCVGLLVSPDVNELCLRDNLTFEELLRPFSQLSKDVTFRDNNNVVHSVKNLQLKFFDISSCLSPKHITQSWVRYFVNMCSTDNTVRSQKFCDGSRSVVVPTSLPWFEAWRYLFITNLQPFEHEFNSHNLACIFVLTTSHPDPIRGFTELTQSQSNQQHHLPGSRPFWFTENVLKFYVLLHDGSSNIKQSCVDEIFNQVKTTFGALNCHLLTIFTSSSGNELLGNNSCVPNHLLFNNPYQANGIISRPNTSTIVHTSENEPHSDPWLHHLLPHGYRPQLDHKLFPPRDTSIKSCDNQITNDNNDPLTVEDSREACSQVFDVGKTPLIDTSCLPASSISSYSSYTFLPSRYSEPHGQHLTQADRDRIHMFVYDFSVRALLPWVEKTMRSLNDQIAHRMRLSRSFFNATKKFFTQAVGGGGGSNNTTVNSTNNLTTLKIYSNPSPIETSANNISNPCSPTNPVIVNNSKGELSTNTTLTPQSISYAGPVNHSTIVYSQDSPESQMRRLADLAFLFQQYEVAYQTYNVLKRDFQNDSAWLHHAGAQEMSALSVYLQGATSQRQYPYHLMDSAVATYLQSHLSPELALRSTLLNFEALCSRGLYNEAAVALIRLTSDEDDLISGLLIEQVAHCVLSLKRPMLRKFAFRMALAAHRYARAKQPILAIRSYKSTMPIVMGHGWSLLEDHINFSVGKQAYLIGDLTTSCKALAETLKSSSRQSAERQLIFVKEYLSTLTKYLSTNRDKEQTLPEFPLPIIDLHNFKIIIGKPSQRHQQQADLFVEARGVQFSDTEEDEIVNEDIGDELPPSSMSQVIELENNTDPFNNVEFQKFTKHYHNWMEATDVSSSSSDESLVDGQQVDTRYRNSDCYPYHVNDSNDESSYRVTHKKIISSQSMMCQRLEYILLQTTLATDKSKNSRYFKRDKIIYTPRSKYKRMPTFPLGEHLTVRITLINPMRIPLVFTNVHLLWIFNLTNSITESSSCIVNTMDSNVNNNNNNNNNPSSHNHINNDQFIHITNEILSHSIYSYSHDQYEMINQFVSGEIINEFIILYETLLKRLSRYLQLSIIAKQLGQITITGLAFEWSYLSPHQNNVENHINTDHYVANSPSIIESAPNVCLSTTTSNSFNNNLYIDGKNLSATTDTMCTNLPPPISNNNDGVPASISERNSVKGKILFNHKKNNSINDNSVIRLPLDWSITHPVPSLRVFFSSFPSQLYEGQICSVQISLTNSGLIPLTNLRIASNCPGLFAFGSVPYDLSPNKHIQYLSIQPLEPWIDVPCSHSSLNNSYSTGKQPSVLMPGTTITQKLWLRGPYLTYPYSRRRHRNSYSHRYPQLISALPPSSSTSLSNQNSYSSNTSGVVICGGSPTVTATAPVTSTINTNTGLLPHIQQKTVHIVFQYESTNNLRNEQRQKPFTGCRYVRHRSELELKSSLNFEAVANCLNITDINDLLISVQIKNVVHSTVPMNFQIMQIACISRYWSIKPIQSTTWNIDTIPSIHVGEIITLYFKASPIKNNLDYIEIEQNEMSSHTSEEGYNNSNNNNTGKKYISVIHFNHHHHHYYCQSNNMDNTNTSTDNNDSILSDMRNIIQNSNLPQSLINTCNDDNMMMMISPTNLEFFCRSGIHWYHQSNDSIKSFDDSSFLDINLLITWKGSTETTLTNLNQSIWGQSHLRINHLNSPVQMPYNYNNNYNILDLKLSKRKFKKCKHQINNKKLINLNNFDLSNLIRIQLNYPKFVNYSQNNENCNDINQLNNNHSDNNNTSYTYSSLKDFFKDFYHSPFNQLPWEQTKKCFVPISVQAKIYNSSMWPIIVQLDMNNKDKFERESITEEVLSSTTGTSHPQHMNPFRVYNSSSQLESISRDASFIPSLIWIGLTKQEFHLQPYQVKCLTLKALAPQFGIFNLCTFSIKAAPLLLYNSHSNINTTNKPLLIDQNIFPIFLITNHNMLSLVIIE
uniref:Trafficking protein particle complex subunit 8 n=1 Tax=Schistosoma mansoni TaxID=6183 RepID=A0A5K4F1E8_SCHMA